MIFVWRESSSVSSATTDDPVWVKIMDRRIAFLAVPDLEIAVARLSEPGLRQRPAAIAPSHHKHPVLWRVSSEAREFGITPGMSLREAQRLCPGIRLIPPDSRRIATAHDVLQRVFQQFSPLHEIAADDEFYVDLSQQSRSFHDAAAIASRIQREIARRHGIAGAIGLSANKLVSHVAADGAGMRSINTIPAGEEASFLAPLPVTSLPGLTQLFAPRVNAMLTLMNELCLRNIGQVAPLSVPQLQLIFGVKARLLKQWSLGIDPSPVWPQSAAPMVQRWVSLDDGNIDDEVLLAVIYRIVQRICSHLRRVGQVLRSAKLIVQYADGRELAKIQRFDPPTCWESEVYPQFRERFLAIERRVRVRSIGLAGDNVPASKQLDLLSHQECNQRANLSVALDAIRKRHGDHAVSHGMTKTVEETPLLKTPRQAVQKGLRCDARENGRAQAYSSRTPTQAVATHPLQRLLAAGYGRGASFNRLNVCRTSCI
jgi:DNA polymerase-4